MMQSDLPAIRQLASNGSFSASDHTLQRMLDRDILYEDVENVLISTNNQIIETQSPSKAPGKGHDDERVLIYDPNYKKPLIVICAILYVPFPEIRIVTVELVKESTWEKRNGEIPGLVRKST